MILANRWRFPEVFHCPHNGTAAKPEKKGTANKRRKEKKVSVGRILL
jgi:hypothetical protein